MIHSKDVSSFNYRGSTETEINPYVCRRPSGGVFSQWTAVIELSWWMVSVSHTVIGYLKRKKNWDDDDNLRLTPKRL